jgi:Protein of unknown function (DUF2971)
VATHQATTSSFDPRETALGSCLYHFTTADIASIILDQAQMRMSPVENMNDPREAKNWIITPISATGEYDPSSFLKAQERLNVRLKRETKVACFSGDGAPKNNRDEEPLERGWAHPRMWAHYGGNHAGACLVFDRARLEVAFSDALTGRGAMTAGQVAYTDLNPALTRAFVLDMAEVGRLGVDRAIDKHAETHLRTLMFTKLLDWATEAEYRFVLRGSNNSFEYVAFGEALLSCCIGPDYPHADPSGVGARLLARGTPMYRVQWINGHPELAAVSLGS